MNNDAILASISKIHAYRYAKEKQRGVLTTNGGFSTTDPALLQLPCTIQCVFVAKQFRSERTQIVFDTRGDSVGPRIDISTSNDLVAFSNYTSITKPAILDKIYDVVFAVSKDSTDVYIDGEKEATLAAGEAKMVRLNLGANSATFYGDWLMYRQFNYLMSADEVKTLDNNGNPLGYVVPKAMKSGDNKCIAEYLPQNLVATKKGPQIEPIAESFEFNIGSPYSQTVIESRKYPFDCIYKVDYVVDEWDFQPKVNRQIGFYGESGASVVAGVNSWIRASDAKIGEVQSCFIKMPNEGNPSVILYGDQDTEETTARRLKVTIKSITPVLAASTWLDSAKQLPWSDAYNPPLLQSKNGYDIVANGSPEILFNE